MEIHIGDRVADVTLVSKDGNKVQLTIDGTPYDVDIVMAENGSCSILHDGKSFNAELIRKEGGKSYTVNAHYQSYNIDIIDSQAKYLRMRKGADEKQQDKIVSPMPGKVVKIPVKAGDRLQAGDIVVVIEAMKMQSNYKVNSECVVKEILAGLCLGVIGMLIPAVMFSGEEQMGVLMKEYAGYMAIALIGIAFLKIILTNLCIQFGLKGGHFFPVIFAGVCLGYGLAMLFFGQQGDSHVAFAAAIVTSTLLGGIMKKPLAVTMLLFLCFPVKIFIWIFIAAAVGSKCVKKMGKEV